MPEDFKPGCQRPSTKQKTAPPADAVGMPEPKEEKRSMIQVGKPAPEFSLPAYIKGKFANVSLSEFKGQWVVVCFYPGDFTFV